MSVGDYISGEISRSFGMEATPSQERLFSELGGFMVSDCDIMLVAGYAGTGKTSSMAAFVRALKNISCRFVLLAPTGRAAKVLSSYTGEKAYTIHKHIYRQNAIRSDMSSVSFSLDINRMSNTVFIVDECSLISDFPSGQTLFGSGSLLDDLVCYVRSRPGNRLVLVGDPAQLPPVGTDCSPAMDLSGLEGYGPIMHAELTDVVRQARESGILSNADGIRRRITSGDGDFPVFDVRGFSDVERITGEFLIETLSDSIDRYGEDEVAVLCSSNRRANRYNAGIRSRVFFREDELVKGEKLMVVKNCYSFLDDVEDLDFIANGDIVNLNRLYNHTERYGFRFADADISLPDYNGLEISVKIVLDTLASEFPSFTYEEQNRLFEGVSADYSHIANKKKRYEQMKKDPFFNAVQVKYASAMTCHKAQGGQWDCVFVDRPFFQEQLSVEEMRWLYTAVTRARKKLYLVNFEDRYFKTN